MIVHVSVMVSHVQIVVHAMVQIDVWYMSDKIACYALPFAHILNLFARPFQSLAALYLNDLL